MNRNQTKILSAALALLLSVVMLVGASFAWFTLSTAPEITGMQLSIYTDLDLLVSRTATGAFTQSITTDPAREKPLKDDTSIDNLQFYATLRPVSTLDGEHWYLPKYLASGELDQVKNFPEATDENVNVVLWEEQNGVYTAPMSADSTPYILKEEKSYYMYADIWLKTENENGVGVTLSVPDISGGESHDNGRMQAWELGKEDSDYSREHGRKYGSFALAKYEKVDNTILSVDNNVQTALRVGFLTEDGTFTIYEPNADQRSDITYKPKDGDQDEMVYVVGYTLEEDSYKTGDYIPTKPIGLKLNEETGLEEPAPVPIPDERLLVQLGSFWNVTSITQNYANPTSADVSTFGKFIKNNADLSDTDPTAVSGVVQDLASDNLILKLRKYEPQRVRVFFWLEGQDVDCWNDIASGSFLVNLEFAAQALPEPLPPATTEPADS